MDHVMHVGLWNCFHMQMCGSESLSEIPNPRREARSSLGGRKGSPSCAPLPSPQGCSRRASRTRRGPLIFYWGGVPQQIVASVDHRETPQQFDKMATADLPSRPPITDRDVSAYWPMNLGQSIHNSYFHAMRAQITCVFSVIIHQNIDPKSTENPATCRTARMHDFGISICCGQNLR